MKKSIGALLFGSVAVLAGCSTINSFPYKSSTANVVSLQSALAPTSTKINVGSFSIAPGVDDSLTCRLLGPIDVSAGKSIATYIKEAFQEELFLAQAYDPRSNITINGEIERLAFSSVSPANWEISLRVSSSRSPGYSVSVTYGFSTSFDAYSACQNVANAFGPAVQEILKKVVADAQFLRLVGRGQ